MATTFNVISLGNLASIDPKEGNTESENADAILGTYWAAGALLRKQVQTLTPDNFNDSVDEDDGGSPTAYDTNNSVANDRFRIDGGPPQTCDAVYAYTGTITYIDGRSATLIAIVFQDTDGKTDLAPTPDAEC